MPKWQNETIHFEFVWQRSQQQEVNSGERKKKRTRSTAEKKKYSKRTFVGSYVHEYVYVG